MQTTFLKLFLVLTIVPHIVSPMTRSQLLPQLSNLHWWKNKDREVSAGKFPTFLYSNTVWSQIF